MYIPCHFRSAKSPFILTNEDLKINLYDTIENNIDNIKDLSKQEKDNILTYLVEAGLVVLILNVVMMTLAYLIAKKFVSGIPQQKCDESWSMDNISIRVIKYE